MSKFFKGSRKKLIEKGALNKYLKYASGEVILTIISILLAIQINNWNQKRVDRNEVHIIIGNLSDEFEQNKTNLESKIEEAETSLKTARNLINLVGKSKVELEKYNLDSLMARSFQYKRFNPSEDVLTVLLSSGKLSLLRNDSVRDVLYSWSSDKITLNEHFEDLDDNMSKILDYLTINYPLKNFDIYSHGDKTKGTNLKVDRYKIFEQLVFENNLENHIYYLSTYIKAMKASGKIIDEIITFSEEYQ